MLRNIFIFGLLTAVVFMFTACPGPKERAKMSELDTPEYHYTQGKKYLEKNDFKTARDEFELAKSLKANFAPAYEGFALIDIEGKNFEQAEKNIDKALSLDGDWIPAVVAKGRLYTAQENYEDAVDEFEDALDDIDDSDAKFDKKKVKMDALYHMGTAYKQWGKYIEAQTTFQKILDIDNTNTKASKAIRELAEYQMAVAGQSPELKKIARQKKITRADVAVLFVTELPLEKIFRKAPGGGESIKFSAPGQKTMGKRETPTTGEGAVATDVPDNHWAKSFIKEALKTGIIELYPDGSYRPEEEVFRGEFAKLIEYFLVRAWDDKSLETKYFGSQSPFTDVLNTAPMYNAIMVVSSRNIIPGFEDGTFKPNSAVSGTEALNIIRNLKALF